MNIEERAAAAAELKATGKCNCTQSVVKVFEDKLPISVETLMKLTAGYAVGMGLHGEYLRGPDWCCHGGRHSHRRQRHAPHF